MNGMTKATNSINSVSSISVAIALLTCSILCLAGCFSGGGGGGDNPTGPVDVNGQWLVSETVDASACGQSSSHRDSYEISVSQNGDAIAVTATTDDGPQTFYGTLSGTMLGWTGSFSLDGGTVTITSMSVTVDSTCNSFGGSSSWSWSDGSYSCAGTTQISGTRLSGAGCGATEKK